VKGHEIISNIVRAEIPDMEQIRENCIRQAANASTVKQKSFSALQRLIPAAVCLFALLAGTLVYTHYNMGAGIVPPLHGSETSGTDRTNDDIRPGEIKGLPVDNFSVQEMNMDVAMCRAWAWMCLPDFFSEEFESGKKPDTFVIVRVTDTQIVEAPSTIIEKFGEIFSAKSGSDRQVSTVSVLQQVWGATTPESFQIMQWDYSGTSIGPTNMLREGGVYILPLKDISGDYYDDGNGYEGNYGENCYSISSDLDVLFEIDDAGRVYSHSNFQDFSWFDGKPYADLADAIVSVSQSSDLPLMLSPFGKAVLTEKLARVEIISTASHENPDPWVYYNARVTFALGSAQGDDILVYYHFPEDSAAKDSLRPGSCYLMFGDVNDGYMGVNPEFRSGWNYAAEILPDGTIRAEVTDDGVFSEYNGYTVDEIKALVLRINAYKTPLAPKE